MSTLNDNTVRNAMLDGIRSAGVFNSGHIRMRDASNNLLAELDFPASAFPSAASAGSMTSGTVVAEASAPYAGTNAVDDVELDNSADTTQMTCTAGTGSEEFVFSGNTNITQGDEVSLDGNTMTMSFS